MNDVRPPESWPSLLAYFKGRVGLARIIKVPYLGGSNFMRMYGSFEGFPIDNALLGWCHMMTPVSVDLKIPTLLLTSRMQLPPCPQRQL